MTIVNDWTLAAAEELYADVDAELSLEQIRDIIVKHCPMKQDVAYMPVPRCEICAHWGSYLEEDGKRECTLSEVFRIEVGEIYTPADFGCVRWQPKRCSFI